MRFKISQKVTFLNEQGGGEIININTNKQYEIKDETGFSRWFNENDIAPIYGDLSVIFDREDDMFFHEGNDIDIQAKDISPDYLRKQGHFWELDLHSHNLMSHEKEKSMHPSQIKAHQLFIFKQIFKMAREKQVKKLVVIHGIGEGVLKREVREFLVGCVGLEFYDGDFREYDKGATCIEFFQMRN